MAQIHDNQYTAQAMYELHRVLEKLEREGEWPEAGTDDPAVLAQIRQAVTKEALQCPSIADVAVIEPQLLRCFVKMPLTVANWQRYSVDLRILPYGDNHDKAVRDRWPARPRGLRG